MADFHNMINNFKVSSKIHINRYYQNIEMLKHELDYLYISLSDYANKKLGITMTPYDRLVNIQEIRDRITDAHKDINYYKELIKVEYNELNRLYRQYNYVDRNPVRYYGNTRYNTIIDDTYDTEENDYYSKIMNEYDVPVDNLLEENDYYNENEDEENEENEVEENDENEENNQDENQDENDYNYNPETGMYE